VTSTTTSAALVCAGTALSDQERLALAGFLAGSGCLAREAYALDLRQFAAWCHHTIWLCPPPGAQISSASAVTWKLLVTRRLRTIAGFYRYAVEEDVLEHSPAVHVRRPAWITSRMRPGWTATKSVRCSSPPGWAARRSTRGSRCSPQRRCDASVVGGQFGDHPVPERGVHHQPVKQHDHRAAPPVSW